jgi:hypothetical protein
MLIPLKTTENELIYVNPDHLVVMGILSKTEVRLVMVDGREFLVNILDADRLVTLSGITSLEAQIAGVRKNA